MDGVLADFDTGIARYGLANDQKFIHLPKDQWTPEQVDLNKQVIQVMRQPGFFRGLPPMFGAHRLWKYCEEYDPIVLTARPDDRVSGERVTKEKRDWIEEQFGPIPDDRFICCLRSEKTSFIGTTDHKYQILVDDQEANCEAWRKAGGIGVVHKTVEETIKELEKIIVR